MKWHVEWQMFLDIGSKRVKVSRIGIVGLGYVGFTLALAFLEVGLRVLVFGI